MEDVEAGVVRRAALQVGVLHDGAVDVPGEVVHVVFLGLGQPVAALALGGGGEHLLLAQDEDRNWNRTFSASALA